MRHKDRTEGDDMLIRHSDICTVCVYFSLRLHDLQTRQDLLASTKILVIPFALNDSDLRVFLTAGTAARTAVNTEKGL